MNVLMNWSFIIVCVFSLSVSAYAEDVPLAEMQNKIYEYEDSIYDKDREVEKKEKDYREAVREVDRKKARQCFESRSDYQACLGDRGADIQKAHGGWIALWKALIRLRVALKTLS